MEDMVDVKRCYDDNVEKEWLRLENNIAEFEISKHYLLKYIKSGDTVLDFGGGPGRYSLFLAERGCDVTLADLSSGNVAFAEKMAAEKQVSLKTLCLDARMPGALSGATFDHILLMGPLYHLPQEEDRRRVVQNCVEMLKPGGILFASFISSYASAWDYYSRYPERILLDEHRKFIDLLVQDTSFSGLSFTDCHYIRPMDIEAFMSDFAFSKLHLLSCEGFLSMRKLEFINLPSEVRAAWIDIAIQACEREDLLSMGEHLMYIGRKP